ncbi:hypothetical protein D1631_07385 [Chryseobacterium nematophagum]|uniref:Uncharacterized protein n=1 Tax=Chryseobacterium nematophagum TaxID=2305228 RepID=A0A3M7TFJ9_9FLAO|nr:hypothetical protein [Chryseobacterium nematophagum]RNA61766.1 hypothetical protein D1631_07385 [Chryseobacterium nematophagum]
MYKPPVPGRKIDSFIKAGVGVGIIIGGLELLDWATSRFIPMLMTPIMIYDINTQNTYQNKTLKL